jgi:coenzyme F420-0:L-glutamate ligase/coenzyme F420-1:gamma-L-glutamate ligase
MITIIGLTGIPLIKKGDDIGGIIVNAAKEQDVEIMNGDVIVVTQKIVSKAEGRILDLRDVEPSEFAKQIATQTNSGDPRHVEAILRETRRIVMMKDGHLIMETNQGFVCANAGVDKSNVEGEQIISLLPENSDESARRIRDRIRVLTDKSPAVIITDTWGRPWRLGQVDFAIGLAGIDPFMDYREKTDMFGSILKVTYIAVADELASAAELVKGKSGGIPVVIIRGCDYLREEKSGQDLIRPIGEDLFR